jgi:hypothetical protein
MLQIFPILADKRTETCPELTSHSPIRRPPYQHLLANEGDYKVGRGESIRLSRRVGPASPPSLDAQIGLPRLSKWAPSILVAFYRLLSRRYGGATGSLLRGHGPYRSLGDACRI